MSTFYDQLLVSVTDKLLLGAVLVLIGYLFNRRLESIRARNAFAQALSAQRVRAIHEIATFVSRQVTLQRDVLATLNIAKETDQKHQEQARAMFQDAYRKWSAHYRDQTHEVMANCVYLDGALADALHSHLESAETTTAKLIDGISEPIPHDELSAAHKQLLATYSKLLHTMQKCLHQSPF
jgi:hypothetical protein